MAINITTLEAAVIQAISDGMDEYTQDIRDGDPDADPPKPPIDFPEIDYTTFATAIAQGVIVAVQTILDDGEVSVTVTDVSTGVDTAPGTGTIS